MSFWPYRKGKFAVERERIEEAGDGIRKVPVIGQNPPPWELPPHHPTLLLVLHTLSFFFPFPPLHQGPVWVRPPALPPSSSHPSPDPSAEYTHINIKKKVESSKTNAHQRNQINCTKSRQVVG